jgi:hypothetical protein
MPDTTVPDHEHGTLAGVSAHKRAGTKLCLPCNDANNDYHQAWRITSGTTKNLVVPLSALREVLAGSDLATVLGGLVGPKSLDAIRVGVVLRG